MRLVISFFIFAQLLWAYNYNDILLEAQSRIYPKILLLEDGFVQRHQMAKKPVVLMVVHEREDGEVAKRVIQKIGEYYGGELANLPFLVKDATFDDIDGKEECDAYYLLKGKEENIKKMVSLARKKRVPVFVYDFEDLAFGATIALDIRRATVIYMNKRSLEWVPRFRQSLYTIVRFMDV
ncbi:hypothetical protein [Hydrogenimonas sp.]